VGLKEEVAAVVKTRDRPAGIAVKNEIGVLIGFGSYSCTQFPKGRDNARRVFESEVLVDHELQLVTFRAGSRGSPNAFLGV
jgi:hypothetical protein